MSEMMPKFFLGPFPEIQRLIFFNNVHYVLYMFIIIMHYGADDQVHK